jgi:hypothetical protein
VYQSQLAEPPTGNSGYKILMQYRLPDILVGCLLTIAVFSIGMLFAAPFFHRDVEIASVKLSDWLLVLFNLFLVVFTGLLWWSTQALWRVTREIGERQSLDTRVLQRAYISTKGNDVRQIENDLVGHVLIRNVGRLPATNIRWTIDMTASNDGDWRPPAIHEGTLQPAGVLAIDGEVVRGGPGRPISTEQYWYLWGLITYDDGFGEQRRTAFCHRYNTAIRQMRAGGGYLLTGKSSRQHEYGNEAN